MRFNILGPLEVLGPHGPVAVTGGRLRGFLAALLMMAGHPVSVERIIDGLWGDRPPSSALANVRTYAYRLRRMLEGSDATLVTHTSAYVLTVPPHQLDINDYTRHVDSGTEALARGCPDQAIACLGTALRLWRGVPFEGQQFASWMCARITALRERHRATTFSWVEANLAAGQANRLIPTLRELVTDDPLSEYAWLLLIRALHRGGHTGSAIAAYHEVRRLLVSELGIEPGPDLQQAHLSILRQAV
jgi:DNA-binding SARP family transcriptional activator